MVCNWICAGAEINDEHDGGGGWRGNQSLMDEMGPAGG